MGQLEDERFNGESAETALVVCKDDLEQVIDHRHVYYRIAHHGSFQVLGKEQVLKNL